MKHHEPDRHPGIWRVMQVDSELAGILIALGFVLMGLAGLPIAKWFFLGAVLLGGVVAVVLRRTKREKPLQSIGLGLQPPPTSQASSEADPLERQHGVERPTRDEHPRQPRLSAAPA